MAGVGAVCEPIGMTLRRTLTLQTREEAAQADRAAN